MRLAEVVLAARPWRVH